MEKVMKKGNFIVAAVAGCVLALTGCGKSVQVEEQTGQTSQNISVAENNSKANVESSGTQQKGVNGGLAFSIYLKAKCEDKYYVFDENGKQILDKDANYQTYALGVHTNYYYNEQLTATVKENTDYQWIGTGLTKNGWGSVKIANSIGKK